MGGHGSTPPAMACHGVPMREIDRASKTPPWQQIAADLRDEIGEGRYAPDDPLPSIERLVQMYGVNRKTARKALVSLAGEGLAEAVSGMGYYVTAGHTEGTSLLPLDITSHR